MRNLFTALCGSISKEIDRMLNELKTAYWEYRTFRADLLPEMNFEATIPSYNKKYNSYQQDNGAYTFLNSSRTRTLARPEPKFTFV